jgi:DNA-binding GntR family transcriptional regulator
MNAYDRQMAATGNVALTISLSERAYRSLRQGLLHGDIAPGAKLKIEALVREYEVSSSPLREALNRLAAEGLVVTDENRGFRAAQMSSGDLKDITALRLVVEPAALTDAIQGATDEWEARIVAAFHRLKRTEERLPRSKYQFDDDWTDRHKNFHMALYATCTSQRLFMLCWNLFDQAERYRRFCAVNRQQPRSTSGEHRALMEAALARDADRSAKLIRQHISRTSDDLHALFSGGLIVAGGRSDLSMERRRADQSTLQSELNQRNTPYRGRN